MGTSEIHHVNRPNEIAVNMVCKFWFPYSDPWGRKMCDWTIGNKSYAAKDGNVVKHGKTTTYNFQVQNLEHNGIRATCAITRTN